MGGFGGFGSFYRVLRTTVRGPLWNERWNGTERSDETTELRLEFLPCASVSFLQNCWAFEFIWCRSLQTEPQRRSQINLPRTRATKTLDAFCSVAGRLPANESPLSLSLSFSRWRLSFMERINNRRPLGVATERAASANELLRKWKKESAPTTIFWRHHLQKKRESQFFPSNTTALDPFDGRRKLWRCFFFYLMRSPEVAVQSPTWRPLIAPIGVGTAQSEPDAAEMPIDRVASGSARPPRRPLNNGRVFFCPSTSSIAHRRIHCEAGHHVTARPLTPRVSAMGRSAPKRGVK